MKSFIKNNLKFSYVYPIYSVITLILWYVTGLTLSDTLFWISLFSLLLAFFTSTTTRASVTKVIRFTDFRNRGIDEHAKEILDNEYDGLVKKESDSFYIPFSTANLIFGIVAFVLCVLVSYL